MKVGSAKFEFVRIVAVLSVIAFIGVLLHYLPSPGYSESRLVLFGFLSGGALLGAVGVIFRNIAAIAAGSIVLFLLGFWQAVLIIFIYPVLGMLVIAAYSEAMRRKTQSVG